ncbi:hypothetical protein L798_06697 [Zootermopsis nevadensis]|uniref:Uncharacterized protein n=1 Tax=Zootermopsis nevadensis TaxID=136037 RepID=A0A067QS15_ZOONE|nr:hypothetical protein L798_06697 [Zootermopsis nevadensis]
MAAKGPSREETSKTGQTNTKVSSCWESTSENPSNEWRKKMALQYPADSNKQIIVSCLRSAVEFV